MPVDAQTPDVVRGAELYQQRCAACHSIDANGVGPKHRGVVGRKAGSVEGYNYSKALRSAGFTWDEARLNIWLQGPGKLLPGVRMYVIVPDPQDRADIIAYLETQRITKK